MSAKKVRRHLRQLQKERRQAARRQEREAKRAARRRPQPAATPPEPSQPEPPEPAPAPEPKPEPKPKPAPAPEPVPAPKPEPKPEPEPEPTPPPESARDRPPRPTSSPRAARQRRRRESGSGVRAGAVLVTLGLLIAGGGSLAMDLTGDAEPPSELTPATFPAADSGTAHVCPPMPGQPDSVTTDGLLEYRDREDSAETRFQTLVFAADEEGSFPPALWDELGEEGRLGETELTSPGDAAPETESAAELHARDVAYGLEQDLTGASLLEIAERAEAPTGIGTAMFQYHADAGAVTGLGVAPCTMAQRSQWFFGPEVGAGASSLLTLANPFDRSATVTVSGYDSDGHRGASGTRTLVVPGQTVRTVNIAALAGADPDLGVSVDASGAPVAAQLQSSRAVGLTGQGLEFLPGLPAAATAHMLPGVPVPESTEEEAAEHPAELWIHAPGDSRATIEVQAYDEDGQVPLENPAVFTVEAGEVDTVTVQGLDPDIYDLVVRSDEPTFVGASTHGVDGGEPEDDEALDFSWQAGAPPLGEGSGTLIPQIGESELRVTATEDEGTVSYRLLDEDGEFSDVQELDVPAGGVGTLTPEDLGGAVAVVVEEAGSGLYANLRTSDEDGRFSLTTLDVLNDPDQSVPVRLRH